MTDNKSLAKTDDEQFVPKQYEKVFFDLHAYYNEDEDYWIKALPAWQFNRVMWLDQVSEFPDVRLETIEGLDADGNQIVRHERYDGVEFQRGTDMSAESFGLMDQHIYMLSLWCRLLQEEINDLKLKLAINEGMQFENMPYNRFICSLKNLNDVKILFGWYNPDAGWVAC